jgi:hypothetical protein
MDFYIYSNKVHSLFFMNIWKTYWSIKYGRLHDIFVEFYVLLTVHLSIIFVNKQLDIEFYLCMFISILHVFRATMYPSSGELIVSIRHLVYINLYRWPFDVQVQPAHQTVIYKEWYIPDIILTQLIFLIMGTWLLKARRE